MLGRYRKWIHDWEYRLATRDSNRIVRPFEWGLEWMDGASRNGDPGQSAFQYLRSAVADSDAFFSYATPADYRLDGERLTFTSPLRSPYVENNTVHGLFFPAARDRGCAAIVLPQWNADAQGHLGVCRLLNRAGVTALRLSLAYHDYRMPRELQRADYHVSSNIGRTVHATRQSVIDVRAAADWLQQRGYQRIGILGTSLGSCVAFIAAAHDTRFRAGVFNHVSMHFGDVVWTGLSTRHVRQALEEVITQDQLRELWAVISPASYLERMSGRTLESLLIWASLDTTFLPAFSRQVVEFFRAHRLPHRVLRLPCGHYTSGQFPFSLVDGVAMALFLRRRL